MATEVDICNQALIAVGANQILSLDAASKEGKLCKALYPKFRDQEMAKHKWNFALKRAELAASATEPVWGYSFALPLPADLLRLVDVQTAGVKSVTLNSGAAFLNNNQAWKVESKNILANTAPLNVLYIAKITDVTKFPVFFVEVLAAKLAAELVIPFRNSDTELLKSMMESYRDKSSMARFSDAVEDDVRTLEAEQWIESRNDGVDSQIPRKIVGP